MISPDVGGLPGAPQCVETLTPTSSVVTGVILFGVSEYQVTFDLAGDCILNDGTYWIYIVTNTGTGTDDWFWELGDVDVTYGLPGSLWTGEYPPVTWNVDAENSLALQLNGTVVPVELQSISVE